MNWIKRKWQKWCVARRTAELRKRGYDYAAGQLLRAKGDKPTIKRLTSEACDMGDFDRGIVDALFDWAHLGVNVRGQALNLKAFANHLGYDLDAIEAELKADNAPRQYKTGGTT